MEKPRILQVVTHFDLGGAEQVAMRLASGLGQKYQFAFFAVLGISTNEIGQELQAVAQRQGNPVGTGTRIEIKRGGLIIAGLRLAQFIRRFRPDVVHLHTEIPEATYVVTSVLLGNIFRQPIVRTIHNSFLWPKWKTIGHIAEARLSGATVAAVSVAATQAVQDLRKSFNLQPLPKSRLRVIYNGVPDQVMSPKVRKYDGDWVKILFAGRLEEQKGADLLPAIFPNLMNLRGPKVQLTIAGKGKFEGFLKRWSSTASSPNLQICIVPAIPSLTTKLHNFDLVIIPSRFEGLPLLAIESLMAGVPVIGTNIPGLNEVFSESYPWRASSNAPNDFAEVLYLAINSQDTWQEVIDAEIAHVRAKFGLERMLGNYDVLYASLIR